MVKFFPYSTMFKLPLVTKDKLEHGDTQNKPMVICVECNAEFFLSDLLGGELEEDTCPRCKVPASHYWSNRPHQKFLKRD